eukprot:Awhi_evm1s4949
MAAMLKSKNRTLCDLNLSHNKIDTLGILKLHSCLSKRQNQHLTTLSLTNNNFRHAEGIAEIATFKNRKKIVKIYKQMTYSFQDLLFLETCHRTLVAKLIHIPNPIDYVAIGYGLKDSFFDKETDVEAVLINERICRLVLKCK